MKFVVLVCRPAHARGGSAEVGRTANGKGESELREWLHAKEFVVKDPLLIAVLC